MTASGLLCLTLAIDGLGRRTRRQIRPRARGFTGSPPFPIGEPANTYYDST